MLLHKPQAAPSILLVVLMEITIAAGAWQILMRHRRGTAIRALAHQWGMRFQPADSFGLAEQIVTHLPLAGAAKVRAGDLIYQWHGNDFFCAFTVSFTRGVLGTKHRHEQVAGMRQVQNAYSWIIAPPDRKLVEQYKFVRQSLAPEKKEPDKV